MKFKNGTKCQADNKPLPETIGPFPFRHQAIASKPETADAINAWFGI